YPVRIGDLFVSRYQIVGKLGFGMTSTVWLTRRNAAILHSIEFDEPPELATYQRLERGPEDHRGRKAIRPLLDSFIITGPVGEHHCLVHPPLWGNLQNWSKQHLTPRRSPPLLASVLRQLFLALDYAKECQVIHTGESYFSQCSTRVSYYFRRHQ
ncbi:Serine/threonine-protein kinase SRPK3, partial [Termitomyces sp. J132]